MGRIKRIARLILHAIGFLIAGTFLLSWALTIIANIPKWMQELGEWLKYVSHAPLAALTLIDVLGFAGLIVGICVALTAIIAIAVSKHD